MTLIKSILIGLTFIFVTSSVEAKPHRHQARDSYASEDNYKKQKVHDAGDLFNGNLIAKASQFIGSTASDLGLPKSLWCADFMNKITGAGNDRTAVSYVNKGRKAEHGCTNCVAVTSRRGGHHVGVVKGYDDSGNPILISGNHGHKVGIGKYSKNKVIAYRYLD